MSQSIFTSQTPSLGDNNDGGGSGIATATSFFSDVDGNITHIRFFSTTTVGGTYTGRFYQVTVPDSSTGDGSLLSSANFAGTPTSASWNLIELSSPVAITANVLYRTSVWNKDIDNGLSRYVATAHFFDSSLTNGHLTAVANGADSSTFGLGSGSIRQGTFAANEAVTVYPNGSFNNASYFIDVVFEPTGVVVPFAGWGVPIK